MSGKKKYYSKKKAAEPSRMKVYGAAGNQLVKDVALLKSLINTETKVLDNFSSVSVVNTGTVTLLNGMLQGTSASTREGNSVKDYSLEINCFPTFNASSTSPYQYVRVMVVRDNQVNGVLPTATQILANVSYTSCKNAAYSKRFKVLADRTICLNSQGNPNDFEKFYFKMGTHTNYGLGNAGNVQDIASGGLYLFYISDAATNAPNMAYYSRYRFIDN